MLHYCFSKMNHIAPNKVLAIPEFYSKALTIASLASMLIFTSALAASSDIPAKSAWAFSRLALAT